jgi:hypothetical protein
MTQVRELISKERLQYWVFAGLSIGILGLTGIAHFSNNLLFRRYLGRIDSSAATILTACLGAISLSILLSHGWFAIYRKENLRGLFRASGLAAILGLVMILIDHWIVLPADINVQFPESLVFYPVIGFLVEIVVHVLPLTLLLLLLTSFCKNLSLGKISWICILIVSLLEPVYQTIAMGPSDHSSSWAVAYVGLHVFVINVLQLAVFRRYDFIAMYSFRLVYYILWHIVWGYYRLELLF